jgi:REP element-mobilizing transposase RayT
MPEKLEPLLTDKIYHIYNHATGKENLFESDADYREFLEKIKKYILPVCDLFSYSLMPNHYHLVVRIKSQQKVEEVLLKKEMKKIKLSEEEISNKLSRLFSDLFNSYAKYYNYVHARRGTLFRRAFRRKPVEGDDYLKPLICYVQRNAVDAGFVTACGAWKYSSFNALTGNKQTLLARDQVIELFDSVDNFIYCCRTL